MKSPTARCCVPSCQYSRPGPQPIDLHFHRMPMSNSEKLERWIKALDSSHLFLKRFTLICSCHFRNESYMNPNDRSSNLRHDALPSKNHVYPCTDSSVHASKIPQSVNEVTQKQLVTTKALSSGSSSGHSSSNVQPSIVCENQNSDSFLQNPAKKVRVVVRPALQESVSPPACSRTLDSSNLNDPGIWNKICENQNSGSSVQNPAKKIRAVVRPALQKSVLPPVHNGTSTNLNNRGIRNGMEASWEPPLPSPVQLISSESIIGLIALSFLAGRASSAPVRMVEPPAKKN